MCMHFGEIYPGVVEWISIKTFASQLTLAFDTVSNRKFIYFVHTEWSNQPLNKPEAPHTAASDRLEMKPDHQSFNEQFVPPPPSPCRTTHFIFICKACFFSSPPRR